ncbi:hypothetical protein LBMAG42_51200 [Deltaproteobacteria bacterium]|nr:hypothetical protein LBMAG42_51200 [Deltaproteobacteria bacterium]
MARPKLQTPKPVLVIFCEGELTEPTWLASLGRAVGNRALDIRPGPGVPLSLVKRAVEELRELRRDGIEDGEVWCVFDIDDHPGVAEARQVARQHGVHLAISNPCFELWLLLHFREQPGMQHRTHIARMLREFVPGYAKYVDFAVTAPTLDAAIVRARRIAEDAAQMGEAGRNPSTDVFKLVERIRRDRPT